MRRVAFYLRFLTRFSVAESCHLPSPIVGREPLTRDDLRWDVVGRRSYVPKVFLRHDIMKNVLTRFLDSKGVPHDAIETVLATKHFYAFHKADFEHFERVVVWWSTIGLHSGEAMGCVLRRHPNMLWIDINALESKMQWFLTTLRFERHAIGDLLTRNPNLLFHHAEILGHFLQLLQTTGIRRDQIQRLIQHDPMLLEYCENVEELQSLLRWLTATVEIRLKTCGAMLLRVPQLMNPVFHEDLPAIYEYLSRLGLETPQIAKVFVRHPEGLLRKRSQIQALLLAMKKHFGLSQREVAVLVVKLPAVLSLERGSLVEFASFLSGSLGLERLQMRELARANPSMLFTDARRKLWPNFLFLREVVEVPLGEIAACPQCCFLKEEFLMQRFEFLKAHPSGRNHLPLSQVLQKAGGAFAKALNKSEASYRQFLSQWKPPSEWKAALKRACEEHPFGERN